VAGLAAILRDLDQPSSGRHPEPAPPGAVWAAGGAGWSPLVLLRKGGARPPFFCVHGAGGNLLTFRDLALRLGAGQPVYGLEAQGADGVSPPAASVEEMASAYLAAIREERPGGPYLLGGYSGGGVVALELAQRMSAAGARVSTVVLLDTFHPTMEARKLGLADHVAGVASEGLGYLPRRARARARRQVSALARDLRLRYYLTRGRQVPYELREDRLMRHFGAISRDYVPRPYHGPVTLFRAREINRVYAHMGPRLGWDEAVLPALEVVEIPGDHESLFREPNIGTLARLLDDLLLRASREASQE
jgi:thioesterase domain-containing protein